LGGLEGEAVVAALLDARSEPDPAIRREVVRALATQHDARAGGALLQIALEDAESERRIIALRGLEGTRTRLDYQDLLRRIQSRQYRSLPSEEKDLLFRALGTIGDDDVVPLLQKILRHSWIPGRTHRDDWPRAASGLARLGTPSALDVLEAVSRHRHRELASVCASALRTAQKDRL
jgi:HEAT repeat protein